MSLEIKISQLGSHDIDLIHNMLSLFAEVFDEPETYNQKRPSVDYMRNLFSMHTFIALVALSGTKVVGALAAYELIKFEQERSEIYIYDLAVATGFRRQGIATELIRSLCEIAEKRGIATIFVQADTDKEDVPAINLYAKLGVKEEVLHFDINVPFSDSLIQS